MKFAPLSKPAAAGFEPGHFTFLMPTRTPETETQFTVETQPLNRDWEFRRIDSCPKSDQWQRVELPHSPFIADLDGRDHWFGECEYRRIIRVGGVDPTARYALYVGAAMHTAEVAIDGRVVGRHEGGYLPFEVEITKAVADGANHVLTLRLDNRENADIPPGKPYGELDFCWYGGLYRQVELRTYPALHITDPNSAGAVGGGGVFLRTLGATAENALMQARVHVANTGRQMRDFAVQIDLWRSGRVVATAASPAHRLAAGASEHIDLPITIERPTLWSPADPSLYDVEVTLRGADARVLDRRSIRYGVRRFGFSRSCGFTVNGNKLRLRGTNRHQEFPRVGYAAPRAAQYRDARRIKEAGFDYVRLSHYPQSPDFLDACDDLGIVVMNAIPGWQYVGGERFRAACIDNARHLIRRDRNHACVALWELSLNETAMPEDFMSALHRVGHEELPGDQMFTCGWIDRYDVYIHSRQHGQIHDWQNGDKALVVAEYGDWEFYAANEGFDQTTGAGVLAEWANSRKFRRDGERGLRQQVFNHMVALNDTLKSPAALDGQWAMFDYARGYYPTRAGCGIMDIFRLPKFSYHFYRSQRDPSEGGVEWTGGAVVFIASFWTPTSDLRVPVFSNCDEVELVLNGRTLGRRRPAITCFSQYLPHPPFIFDVPQYESGSLEAVGWIGGVVVTRHQVLTPGAPARLELVVDDGGVDACPGEPDVLTACARIVDVAGTLCVEERATVVFASGGAAEIIGPVETQAEAGVASVVLRLPAAGGRWSLQARASAGGKQLNATWDSKTPV